MVPGLTPGAAQAQDVFLKSKIFDQSMNGILGRSNGPEIILQTPTPTLEESLTGPLDRILEPSKYGSSEISGSFLEKNTVSEISPEVMGNLKTFGTAEIGLSLGFDLRQSFMPFRAVPPDEAVGEIEDQIKILPEPARLRIADTLHSAEAISQRNRCTIAVNDLTKDRSELGGRDLMGDFSRVCIGNNFQAWANGTVSALQRSMTDTCVTAYENYRRECLGQGTVATDEQEPFVGVLVRRVGNTNPREIICTATLVDFDVAVTAAHCFQDLPGAGTGIELGFVSQHSATVERKVVAIAQAPDYQLKTAEDVSSHAETLPFTKENDIAFVFFKRMPQEDAAASSTLLFPTFSKGELYHPTALVGFQFLAKREFILKWLKDTQIFLDDEALLQTGAWQKFIMKESTAHCMPIKSLAETANTREMGHQCQSFGGTSGAPMFAIREDHATFEIGALHTLAARLENSDATQAINEGVLVPSDLADVKTRLTRQFEETIDD
ncbi:trypsin-like serine protease [Rhizobium leguminosarum]|uniref:trypsin-like serine protease n=1 Tax=Rhizobium leguminosarum TaxID=384 RepID=UPI003F9DA875